jgi:hypothetical protein
MLVRMAENPDGCGQLVRPSAGVRPGARAGWRLGAGVCSRSGDDVNLRCNHLTLSMSPLPVGSPGRYGEVAGVQVGKAARTASRSSAGICLFTRYVTAPRGLETEIATSTSSLGMVTHFSTALAISYNHFGKPCSKLAPCWTKVHYALQGRPSHTLLACTSAFRVGSAAGSRDPGEYGVPSLKSRGTSQGQESRHVR